MKALKIILGIVVIVAIVLVVAPWVVTKAWIKEEVHRNTTWTPEAIQAQPYLYLKSQVAECDKAKARMDDVRITLVRMATEAVRRTNDAEVARRGCQDFLDAAKDAYQRAGGNWPVVVNGVSFSEEELLQRVTDARERIKILQEESRDGRELAKKVALRKQEVEKKISEILQIQSRLAYQAKQVKANMEFAKVTKCKEDIDGMKHEMETIKSLMDELNNASSKMSLDDIVKVKIESDRKKEALDFLKN